MSTDDVPQDQLVFTDHRDALFESLIAYSIISPQRDRPAWIEEDGEYFLPATAQEHLARLAGFEFEPEPGKRPLDSIRITANAAYLVRRAFEAEMRLKDRAYTLITDFKENYPKGNPLELDYNGFDVALNYFVLTRTYQLMYPIPKSKPKTD